MCLGTAFDIIEDRRNVRSARDQLRAHNFYGHISSLMSAHFCAAIPNFRIMEIDIDDVPWKDEIVTNPPIIENGALHVPSTPGWGSELNENGNSSHIRRNKALLSRQCTGVFAILKYGFASKHRGFQPRCTWFPARLNSAVLRQHMACPI